MPNNGRTIIRAAWLLVLLSFSSLLLAGQEPADKPSTGSIRVIIGLADPPLAQYQGTIGNLAATALSKTGESRLNLERPESRAYLDYLESAQNTFKFALMQAVPEARVQYAYRVAFNGLTVLIAPDQVERLRSLPGVVSVSREREFKMDMDASLPLVGLGSGKIGSSWTDSGLWQALGGHGNAGKGMRVADIDTGISLSNPCFDPSGFSYPAGYPRYGTGYESYVTPKIIAARAYFRPDDPPVGPATPADDTLELGGGHGTHTAGTIACNYGVATPFSGTTISGVAPRAQLMVYRVFYRSKSGSNSAWTPELVAAIEDAVADGAQIVNNSWGGTGLATSTDEPETKAYYAAIDAGLVVIFSAGNNGSGPATLGHPGYGKRFITAGASTTDRLFQSTISAVAPTPPPDSVSNIKGISVYTGSGITAPVIDLQQEGYTDNIACNGPIDSTLPNGTKVGGKIVIIRRGTCNLVDKAKNAQAAGAVAVVVRNVSGGSTTMPIINAVIPYVHVNERDGGALFSWLAGFNTSGNTACQMRISGPAVAIHNDTPDVIASFSSRGPTPDFEIKPDLTAPGVNILSSVAANVFDFLQGTSMAAPHITGAATLLKQLHPEWTHDQIKSALITTAAEVASLGQDPMDRGSGRLNLDHPNDPGLTMDMPSVSFGLLFPDSKGITSTRNVTVKNVSSAVGIYSITVVDYSGYPGMRPLVNPSTLKVQPGQTASFELKLYLTTGVSQTTTIYGKIVLTDGTANHALHMPYWARLKPDLGDADVLLIDDDGSADSLSCIDRQPFYATTLRSLGLRYVTWEVRKSNNYYLDFNQARRYPKVLYFTGDRGCGGNLSYTGYEFWNYMADGGRMLITGQDIGKLNDFATKTYNWNFDPPDYFGASYVGDTLAIGGNPVSRAIGDTSYSSFLAGRQYDFGTTGDGAKNQISPDELRATLYTDVDALPILASSDSTNSKPRHLGTRMSYEPTIERAKWAQPGTWLDYRGIFLSFGLEGVNNNAGTGTGTREELLSRLIAWLDDTVSVKFNSASYSAQKDSTVTFQATANVSIVQTSTGYANSISRYRWDYGDGSPVAITTAPSTTHAYAGAGTFIAYVEATDTFGHKALAKVTVTIAGGAPGAATLISPKGSITTTTPAYVWNAVANSTWYYLWVQDSEGEKIKAWYTVAQANCSSGTGSCSVTPSTPVAAGQAQWWVQTYNDSGYGPWSSGLSFTVGTSGIPGAATLVSPSGTIATATPVYTWNAVPNSTWYYLWVRDSTGDKIKEWYKAEQANCGSGTGSCSVTPGNALAEGNGQWWIQTWNDAGFGPWSSGLSFTVSAQGLPGAATLISPLGSISTLTPTYIWVAVADSTWYYLWVRDSTGDKIKAWYTAAQANCISGTGACSVTPATPLAAGNGQWWVQTWNSVGFGPWSSGMTFSAFPSGVSPLYPRISK